MEIGDSEEDDGDFLPDASAALARRLQEHEYAAANPGRLPPRLKPVPATARARRLRSSTSAQNRLSTPRDFSDSFGGSSVESHTAEKTEMTQPALPKKPIESQRAVVNDSDDDDDWDGQWLEAYQSSDNEDEDDDYDDDDSRRPRATKAPAKKKHRTARGNEPAVVTRAPSMCRTSCGNKFVSD